MGVSIWRGRRVRLFTALAVSVSALVMLAACAGPTDVETQAQSGAYTVKMTMDPQTLNPPQQGTLSFAITDAKDKPVTNFVPLYGALIHNVLVTSDLTYFKHGFSNNVQDNQVSIQTYWPVKGRYASFTLFQPVGAQPQTYTATISSGTLPGEAELVEDTSRSRVFSGVRIEMLNGTGPVKAGTPVQLAFHVSERGTAVNGLWPVGGGAGQLWIVDEHASLLAHEMGAAEVRRLSPQTNATSTETTASTPTEAGATGTSTAVPSEAVPTLVPELQNALATITANPAPTLAPVQQTAQVSVMGTPMVQPEVGYGPDVIFTHTFPEPGLYKMWLEVQYRDQVITADFMVRAEK